VINVTNDIMRTEKKKEKEQYSERRESKCIINSMNSENGILNCRSYR